MPDPRNALTARERAVVRRVYVAERRSAAAAAAACGRAESTVNVYLRRAGLVRHRNATRRRTPPVRRALALVRSGVYPTLAARIAGAKKGTVLRAVAEEGIEAADGRAARVPARADEKALAWYRAWAPGMTARAAAVRAGLHPASGSYYARRAEALLGVRCDYPYRRAA